MQRRTNLQLDFHNHPRIPDIGKEDVPFSFSNGNLNIQLKTLRIWEVLLVR